MTTAASMTDDLRSDIQPMCPLDSLVMVYDGTYLAMTDPLHPNIIERYLPSYRCADAGCGVRYRHTKGYFTLEGSLEYPTVVRVPDIKVAKCPEHGHWLYMRAPSGNETDVAWGCAVRGCGRIQRG
jgi:hypothetical protein